MPVDEESSGGELSINGQKLDSMSKFAFNDTNRQLAILGHLLIDESFFMIAHRRIRPDWFAKSLHHKIYQWFLDLHKQMGKYPTMDEMKNCSLVANEDVAVKLEAWKEIEFARSWAGKVRKDALKEELTAWMHSKILHDAMIKASKTWNQKKWLNTAGILESATKEVRETSFDPVLDITFRNSSEWMMAERNNEQAALTTGCYLLDRALLKRAVNDQPDDPNLGLPRSKGLQLGDTTVVLAASNTGKTSALITIARHNVMDGKNVLLMTHEGRPEDIRNKIFRAMLEKTQDEVFEMYGDAGRRAAIIGAEELLSRRLKYIPYNRAGMLVEDIIPIIRHEQERRVASEGKGYDLLVVDYPALLSTEKASHGHMSPRHVQDLVYQYYVQLALEYGFHSLLAIQTNREGSRINSGNHSGKSGWQSEDKDHRLLGMEDVMEAWGPMTSASNVITLNRTPQDKVNNRMTYFVAKSRSSETGVAVVVKTKFAACLTHYRRGDFRSCSYQGTRTLEGAIDGHLLNSNGQQLTPGMVYEDSKK